MHLRDSQELQFRLAPAAARRAVAANAGSGGTDTVNAIIARLHPDADPALVAETARRWKHLAALTDQEQSNLLTLSVVNRARVQLGMFTVVLLFVSAVIIALIIYTMTMDNPACPRQRAYGGVPRSARPAARASRGDAVRWGWGASGDAQEADAAAAAGWA